MREDDRWRWESWAEVRTREMSHPRELTSIKSALVYPFLSSLFHHALADSSTLTFHAIAQHTT